VTPSQYLHATSVLLGGSTGSAMEADGFRRADTIRYQTAAVSFGAEAIQFGSPAQAAAFERSHFAAACRAGVATDVRPLPGIAGGSTFVYHDAVTPPYRSMFLVGDTVVRLNVCGCDEGGANPRDVLTAWTRTVDAYMRSALR
jgi:hypothetical protein